MTTTTPTTPATAGSAGRSWTRQDQIRAELGIEAPFEAALEVRHRVDFLADYLRQAHASGYVLGISGGVDSTTAGQLARLACDQAGAMFTAVRLPYGAQADEADAAAALDFIDAHRVVSVNIQLAVDAMHAATTPVGGYPRSAAGDFVKGNIKARQRMVAQYAIASSSGALVVGTDHGAEAVMGFFTKYGDGGCDVAPLAGLTKRRVRAIAEHLGAPAQLVAKIPTADLEDDRPGLPDEVAYGVTYDQIDDYLEGLVVDDRARDVIEAAYAATAHKRALPVTP